MKLRPAVASLGALFVVALAWWAYIFLTGAKDTIQNYLYGVLLGVVPLLGGIFGLSISRGWGYFSSALGKATFLLSLGLITWGLGTFIFAYYNLAGIAEVPYPSWADAYYILSWPLWGAGMIFLSSASGAKFGLRKTGGKALLLVIPVVVILASYYLLVVVARGGQVTAGEDALKTFFDLAYPVGDVVILTLATLVYGLSYDYFGGRYKYAIYALLAGFVANYFADFAFSYTTTLETFFVASWVDGLFTIALFLLSLGLAGLEPPVKLEA